MARLKRISGGGGGDETPVYSPAPFCPNSRSRFLKYNCRKRRRPYTLARKHRVLVTSGSSRLGLRRVQLSFVLFFRRTEKWREEKYIYIYVEGERERKRESVCKKFIVIAGLSVIRFRCSATWRAFPFLKFTFEVYISGIKIRRILSTREQKILKAGYIITSAFITKVRNSKSMNLGIALFQNWGPGFFKQLI